MSRALQFPHGDCSVRFPISLSRGLDGIPGPPGSGSSSFSPLPEVLRGGCGLSVSGPVLRPLFSPSGVHPRHGSCLVNYASPQLSSSSLLRRLASPGLHLPGTSAGKGLPPLAVSSPRHHSQSFEELFGPDSDSGLSQDDARDFSFEGFPDPQTGSEVLSFSSGLLVRPPPSCVGLAESSRHDVIHVSHSSRISSPHEVSPASPQYSRSSPGRRGSRILGRWLPQGSSVVVLRLPSVSRSSPRQGSPRSLSYLRKQGGTLSSSLNAVAQELLHLCESQSVRLLPQFIPGHLNVLADSLSRRSQVLGSEWTLCPQAVSELLRRWQANINLFATSLNHRLPVYFSPMYDPQSAGTDAMLQSWDGLQAYAFPPFSLLPRALAKVRASRGLELTLVGPFWPRHHWFLDLLELLLEIPVFLPRRRDLLRQPHFHHFHQNLSMLQLTAFRISGDPLVRPASLTQWLVSLPTADAVPPASTIKPSG